MRLLYHTKAPSLQSEGALWIIPERILLFQLKTDVINKRRMRRIENIPDHIARHNGKLAGNTYKQQTEEQPQFVFYKVFIQRTQVLHGCKCRETELHLNVLEKL